MAVGALRDLGAYRQQFVQTFAVGGTFTPPAGVSASNALLCDITVTGAGGGGGGYTSNYAGSGGSAGQVLQVTSVPVTGAVSVAVGAGGAGGSAGSSGSTGGSSTFGSITALGGGGGSTSGTTQSSTTLMPTSSAGGTGGYGGAAAKFLGTGDSGAVAYSTDGLNWSTSSMSGASTVSRPAFGNGNWVVVDNIVSNKVWSSTNGGASWSSTTFGSAIVGSDVIFANGLFVITMANANIAYSSTGTSWTAKVNALPSGFAGGQVASTNGIWAATGSSTTLAALSADGISWQSVAMASTASNSWTKVTAGNGIFVVWQNSATVTSVSSNAGTTWTTSALPFNAANINFANGYFWATGTGSPSSAAAYSADGKNWTVLTPPTLSSFYYSGINWINGQYVAMSYGESNYAISTDGRVWTARSVATAGFSGFNLRNLGAFQPALGTAPASQASLTTISPTGGTAGNATPSGSGGTGGGYSSPSQVTAVSSGAATIGQVPGAGGGGGGAGSTSGAAGADGQVIVTYWA